MRQTVPPEGGGGQSPVKKYFLKYVDTSFQQVYGNETINVPDSSFYIESENPDYMVLIPYIPYEYISDKKYYHLDSLISKFNQTLIFSLHPDEKRIEFEVKGVGGGSSDHKFIIDVSASQKIAKIFTDSSSSGSTPTDTAPLSQKLDDIIGRLDSGFSVLHNTITAIDCDKFSFISLNGTSGTFKDGTKVSVKGYSLPYTVVSSQHFLNVENQYMVMYLLNREGKNFLVPSAYVSEYVEQTGA